MEGMEDRGLGVTNRDVCVNQYLAPQPALTVPGQVTGVPVTS